MIHHRVLRSSISLSCATVLGAALLGVAVPVARAAGKADLVVSKLGVTPTVVAIGRPFKLATTIANKGKRKAGASTLRYFASFDRVRDESDVRMTGAQKVPSLARGASVRKSAKISMPDSAPIEDVFIVACADAAKDVAETNEKNNCAATAKTVSVNPALTSLDLIEKDLREGLITPDQAAIYKMQDAFGFPDPPARYQVDEEETLEAGPAVKQVAEDWGSLSEATQQALDPYFSPPIYSGARMSVDWEPSPPPSRAVTAEQPREWFCYGGTRELETAGGWEYIDTVHFRFWYYTAPDLNPDSYFLKGFNANPEGSRFLAESLADIAEDVYQKETDLFQREPISDAAVGCNGGDGRIDVYAGKLSTAAAAQVIPYPPGSVLRPGWMFISPSYANTTNKIRDVFAHEFAHMIQLAYDYADVPNRLIDYLWLEEATANWAIDYLYPADNFEHQFAKDYLHSFGFKNPINESEGIRYTNGYDDYLFLFFVTRRAGNPLIMRSIWNKTETLNSVKSVDQAIPGGFSEQWPEFAKHNMNRGGEDYYQDWDNLNWAFDLTGKVQPRIDVDLKGKSRRKILMPGDRNREVRQLATKYTSFEFTDPKVRHVTFRAYGFRDQEPVDALYQDVQAWIELENGDTRVEDWNDGGDVSFCRNEPDENIKRLVILYSNGVPTDEIAGEHGATGWFPESREAAVEARSRCAFTKATGTITFTEDLDHTNSGDCCREQHQMVFTIDIKMKFVDTAGINGFDDDGSSYSWGYNETQSGIDDGCQYSKSESGEGGGAMQVGSGGLVEPGGYNADGEIADSYELHLSHWPTVFHFPTTMQKSWTACPNGGSASTSDDATLYFTTETFPDGEYCSTGEGFTRFVGPSPESLTLNLDCARTNPDAGWTRTLQGTLTLE